MRFIWNVLNTKETKRSNFSTNFGRTHQVLSSYFLFHQNKILLKLLETLSRTHLKSKIYFIKIEGRPSCKKFATFGIEVRAFSFWSKSAYIIYVCMLSKKLHRKMLDHASHTNCWPINNWPKFRGIYINDVYSKKPRKIKDFS